MKKTISLALCFLITLSTLQINQVTVMAAGESASIVAASDSVSYFIKKDSSLWGLGSDFVGGGTGYSELVWTPIKILDGVKSVSAANYQRAAVKKDGSLWLWGSLSGLYNGEYDPSFLVPTKVLDDVKMASLDESGLIVLKTDGSVWVNNLLPGNGSLDYNEGFTKVLDNCHYVAAGNSCAYAINDDNELWAWGVNYESEVGNRSTDPVLEPIKILDDVREINAGSPTIMAIRMDNSLYSWGASGNNGIYTENGYVYDPGTPYKVMDNVKSAAGDTNGYQMAVIKTDHTLWAWGDENEFVYSDVPIKLYDNAQAMALGARHIAVVFRDQTFGTAGDNSYKVLGHGDVDSWGENTPLQIIANDLQDAPATWAYEEVEEAIGLQLIPNELQSDFEKTITREEFCVLAIQMIEVKTDMSIEDYIKQEGLTLSSVDTFSDTVNPDILAAHTLSITSGYPDGTFKPDMGLTREQAAKFLTATAAALGQNTDSNLPAYSDATDIANWAQPYVGYVYDIGVMKGVSNNQFAPKAGYQRQQSIMTMLRLFKAFE